MAENRQLTGTPSKLLVMKVRRILKQYVRSSPRDTDTNWRLAWEWASDEADRDIRSYLGKRFRKKWPRPHEIASRYLMLCLAEMSSSSLLNIGYDAAEHMPALAKIRIAEAGMIARIRGDFGIELKSSEQPTLIEERP